MCNRRLWKQFVVSLCWLLGAATSCVAEASGTAQVIVYNLSNTTITVNWNNTTGGAMSGAASAGQFLALGQITIPNENNIQITPNSSGYSNASLTLTTEGCVFEPWTQALSDYYFNPDADGSSSGDANKYISKYAYYRQSLGSSSAPDTTWLCLQNTAGTGVNYSVSMDMSTWTESDYSGGSQPIFGGNFQSTSQPFSANIAMGAYAPTSFNYNNAAAPAFYNVGGTAAAAGMTLSPTGLTPCIGSICAVPYDGTNFENWPVTIYYYSSSEGDPELKYASASSSSNTAFSFSTYDCSISNPVCSGINVPSYLTNMGIQGADDVYVSGWALQQTIPSSAGQQYGFPLPCWPLYDQSTSTLSCGGAPEYLSNNTQQIQANTTGKISIIGSIEFAAALVGLF